MHSHAKLHHERGKPHETGPRQGLEGAARLPRNRSALPELIVSDSDDDDSGTGTGTGTDTDSSTGSETGSDMDGDRMVGAGSWKSPSNNQR